MNAGIGSAEALEPVRAAILRRAHADADAARRDADHAAVMLLGEARAEAERLLLEARATGTADAAVLTAAERTRARRKAGAVLLQAQRQVSDELRGRVIAALRTALDTSGGRAALTARITEVLGPQATITPAAGGGLIGVHAGVAVDCSIPQLAEQAIAAAPGLGRMWT